MTEAKKSNRAGCIVLAIVLGLVVIVAFVGLSWLVMRGLGQRSTKVARGTVLEISLAGFFTEGPAAVDLGPLFGVTSRSLWDLRRALEAAGGDSSIAGVRLRLGGTGLGWSSAEEVLGYLDAFRETGKPIYASLDGDMVGDGDYFLATAADRIYMTPETASIVNGVAAEVQFYRGSLEKLHVEPEVIMYKEYKSAGEPYLNYEMSEYMRESMTAVLDSIHSRFTQRVSERRGISVEALESFLELGMAPASTLLEVGLIDELGYEDQLEAALAELGGVDEYHATSLSRYLSSLGRPGGGGRRIAVIFGEGPVVTSAPEAVFPLLGSSLLSGARVARHIEQAVDDPRVDAIVFRINSPGGSAAGSDLVRRAIERAREAGKPVVASMSDLAGSGGYWVAMAADEIVAHPTTMTGSIGVVFTKFNLDGFFEWIGTHVDRITTSPSADLLSLGALDEKERAGVLSWMDSTYDSFTAKVASARELDSAEVQRIAKGRVWSGRDARELGLVDELGGLDLAIDRARELAGMDPESDFRLMVVPRAKTLWESLLEENRGVSLPPAAGTGLLPGGAEIERWLRNVARPQVQARMPSVVID